MNETKHEEFNKKEGCIIATALVIIMELPSVVYDVEDKTMLLVKEESHRLALIFVDIMKEKITSVGLTKSDYFLIKIALPLVLDKKSFKLIEDADSFNYKDFCVDVDKLIKRLGTITESEFNMMIGVSSERN